ncbi:2-oxoacid:ferredoxin oxidoreductase subunit beta [Porphyromonadaceae sp. NP-X]|jgi:2-oxoglutarate ferredoxin oxidoreductase subunit beta|nr:2-oxoacid:ferredoxin oxidoreductase subunit beta [Porphyromonadaceae sp. NP-X]NLJ20211.1 2-oxoacid:ferredoxin oxidoreductase subunit beta [Bacteroidales bacterium]HNZ61476.1 2-oxoacid:ferredoxin oxidoreductase subunit beta [Paludibacteraceae bacterium]
MEETKYLPADFKTDQQPRWCPGCGDYAIFNSLVKTMAELGVAPHETVIISGIGCSSRLPYYTNTYGFHTIHGRGACVATGVKVANPGLTVWQVTGDGDCLAIGGNHFIHSVRRNVDINVLLFNNQIYGLTKGQYSPTTKKGFVTKSSPYGTVERPFRPAELTFGAGGTFFGRLLDVDLKTSQMVMMAAARHKGTSVVECLVNCVIFNDGAHGWLAEKETRDDRIIVLEHGKPMIFGKSKDKGLILDGYQLKVVTIGVNGISENDILIHDAKCKDTFLHTRLALMEGPEMPIAMGVIRDVDEETYEMAMENQINEIKKQSSVKSFDELIDACEQWEI